VAEKLKLERLLEEISEVQASIEWASPRKAPR